MADEKNITTQQGQNWQFNIDQAGIATLRTGGKFVDRDIDINVPQAEVNLTAVGSTGEVVEPTVSSTVEYTPSETFDSEVDFSTVKPSTGKYITINPVVSAQEGSAVVKVSSSTAITKPGYIDTKEADSADGADVEITGIQVQGLEETSPLYIPVKTITEDNIEGSTSLIVGEDESKDNFKVTLNIPAGYYDKTTIEKDFSDLLPALDNDATADFILYGKTAYDENGAVIYGSMTNNSDHAPVVSQTSTSSTSIVGTSITLDETDNSSGLKIEASGTAYAEASIDSTGYYLEGKKSVEEKITTDKNTRYITDITIGNGNVLNSVTTQTGGKITTVANLGTIEKLGGTGGVIQELAGSQTINNLTGTLTILDSTDEDEDKTNASPGKLIYGNKTLVKDGDLVAAKTTPIPGGFRLSEGWVSEPVDLGLEAGEYSVACQKSEPSVTLKAEGNVTLATSGTYSLTLSSDSIAKGSHKATASITKGGYIPQGTLSSEVEEIGVDVQSTTVYLNTAQFSSVESAEKYEDYPDVSKYYQILTTEGYTEATSVEEIPIFNGAYSWANS